MLDFLGVTEHFSCMENTPFSFPALFRDMAGEAVSLDGVIFSGSIVSANQEVIEISIEKGESSNEVIFSFPALPEGRWSYNVLVQADDGSQRILFSGYISVLGVSRVAQLASGPPMKNRTLLVAMPGEATMRLRMEWMATTAAQAFAYHALQASKNAHADAETASQAAKTATDAAATAATRAEAPMTLKRMWSRWPPPGRKRSATGRRKLLKPGMRLLLLCRTSKRLLCWP